MEQVNNINNMPAASSHQPLISVVVATYNGARYIREQLDSIIHQTYSNIEVIITDDRSTDETMSILDEYAAQYPNIRVYQNETNLKYVKNFEKGMRLAKGNLIAPSDQDDIWELDKLQVLMDHIGDHAIIYCNSVLIDAQGKEMGQQLSDIKRLDSFDSCLNYAIGNSAPGHAMLIRKQVIDDCGTFPTMIPHDYWLGFVATFNSQVYFLDRVMVRYRQHDANVFGAAKAADRTAPKAKKIAKTVLQEKARERIYLLYQKVPDALVAEKQVFKALYESYQSFGLYNNFKRMFTFFAHNGPIMAYKRRNAFRRWLFCLKMFVKIE
jgi:glycosyltransferase involved in cell wall biosynthesis